MHDHISNVIGGRFGYIRMKGPWNKLVNNDKWEKSSDATENAARIVVGCERELKFNGMKGGPNGVIRVKLNNLVIL